MHLFKSIWYKRSGQEIEKIIYPGQATMMLGLLKYPDVFSKSKGLNLLCPRGVPAFFYCIE